MIRALLSPGMPLLRLRPRPVAAPYFNHRAQARAQSCGDLKAGVKVADIDIDIDSESVDTYPRPSRSMWDVIKSKGHHGATARPELDWDRAADVPHEQVWVEVLVPKFSNPPGTPRR